MKNDVHLVSPHRGSFCGLEGHEIYTRKDRELAGMNRLAEVNCRECLVMASAHCNRLMADARNMMNEILAAEAILISSEVQEVQDENGHDQG